ncbi:Uncharacterised protein [Vibrio cholerae]|nr:Uncharacterised protein [Vibrio cholerae]
MQEWHLSLLALPCYHEAAYEIPMRLYSKLHHPILLQ